MLCEVAARLRSAVRTVDTVARLGGDEFALVLPEIGSAEDAHRLIEKLMAALRQPFAFDGKPLDVSVSLGVSMFPGDGDSPDSLTVQADAAMYEAKQAGKNCYRFFSG